MARKQKNEKLISVTDFDRGTDLLKHIVHPDPYIARRKAVLAARAGEYPKTTCPHPISQIGQYIEDSRETDRIQRPTNLMECNLCHSLLWLTDPYGTAASDG